MEWVLFNLDLKSRLCGYSPETEQHENAGTHTPTHTQTVSVLNTHAQCSFLMNLLVTFPAQMIMMLQSH